MVLRSSNENGRVLRSLAKTNAHSRWSAGPLPLELRRTTPRIGLDVETDPIHLLSFVVVYKRRQIANDNSECL